MDEKKVLKDFMVEIELPRDWSPEFMELVPKQRDELEALLAEGVIDFYSLSLDRSKLWILVNGYNKVSVIEKIAELTMARFFKTDVHDLMFTRANNHITATFSLN